MRGGSTLRHTCRKRSPTKMPPPLKRFKGVKSLNHPTHSRKTTHLPGMSEFLRSKKDKPVSTRRHHHSCCKEERRFEAKKHQYFTQHFTRVTSKTASNQRGGKPGNSMEQRTPQLLTQIPSLPIKENHSEAGAVPVAGLTPPPSGTVPRLRHRRRWGPPGAAAAAPPRGPCRVCRRPP